MTDWLAHDLGESASGVEMGRMPWLSTSTWGTRDSRRQEAWVPGRSLDAKVQQE